MRWGGDLKPELGLDPGVSDRWWNSIISSITVVPRVKWVHKVKTLHLRQR